MNAVSEIQPTTAPAAAGTPGGLLRQEREQRGLTVQQVSEELLLDACLIEALEENRFRALGAPVYAKGHLRKYAVLLGLPPDLILARYQVIAEPPPPAQLPPRGALLTTDPIKQRGLNWRRIDWSHVDWRAYLIIGGVLLLSSSFLLLAYSLRFSQANQQAAVLPSQVNGTRSDAESQPVMGPSVAVAPPMSNAAPAGTPTAVTQRPTTAVPTNSPLPTNNKTAAVPPRVASSVPATNAAVRPMPTRIEPAKPAVAVVPTKVAATQAAAAPKGTEPKIATVNQPLSAPKPMSAAVAPKTAQPELGSPAAEEAGVPQVSLRLEFAVASWAEVYDADGRRLLYTQGDPSRPRMVSGKPPLKVTLGMAGSVQARVNGRPVAIPRRIGQDSASFTIGSNGAIR